MPLKKDTSSSVNFNIFPNHRKPKKSILRHMGVYANRFYIDHITVVPFSVLFEPIKKEEGGNDKGQFIASGGSRKIHTEDRLVAVPSVFLNRHKSFSL